MVIKIKVFGPNREYINKKKVCQDIFMDIKRLYVVLFQKWYNFHKKVYFKDG